MAILPVPGQVVETNAPQPYTRIANPDTNTTQLQIALRKFVPAQGTGPAVWLAAVMHVGEPKYYQQLQTFLAKQTVVLYEGVNPEAHPHHVQEATDDVPRTAEPGTNETYSLQSALARSLGLVFQLEAIDYDRSNFLNSDLSIEQIQHIMAGGHFAAAGQPSTNLTFDVLLQIMDGSSFLGSLVKTALHFVAGNMQVQAVAKLTLIEAIGRLKGNLAEMQGLPPDWQELIQVLIEARDQNLVNDLKSELQQVPASGSIAVFYGAGHMDDLETRVTHALHYKPADEIWLPAFSVDLRQTGLTPFEAQWLRNIIAQQMNQMQPAHSK